MVAEKTKGVKFLECIGFQALFTYVKVGRLLHVMTAVEVILLCLLCSTLPLSVSEEFEVDLLLSWALVALFGALPILGQMDARSRFQNYKQIRDQMIQYGFDKRILRPTLKSRCLRDAAQAAADEVGHGSLCRTHFLSRGYRWYHLLPDFVFRSPQFLFTGHFWRTTFFVPTYCPRF